MKTFLRTVICGLGVMLAIPLAVLVVLIWWSPFALGWIVQDSLHGRNINDCAMIWRPVSTAPKDGTPVLLWDVNSSYGCEPKGGSWVVASYYAYSECDVRHPGGQWNCFYGPGQASHPSHWAHLPPHPIPTQPQPPERTETGTGKWVEVPFYTDDTPSLPTTANPAYVTVSDEEAKNSTIELRDGEILNLLDPKLVKRMKP